MRYSDLWQGELHTPTPPERRLDRATEPDQMTGFWRIQGARTKPDYPVAIWRKDGETAVIVQIGRKTPFNTETDRAEFDEFASGSWLKCVAVSYDDWGIALKTGRWSDGKPSRQLTDEEKLGVAPATEGGNDPPVEESLADQIAALAETIGAQPEPTTQDQANKLAGDLDRMRGLLKLAEAERVREKEPHLAASREVDARWKGIAAPGTDAYDAGEKRRKAYLLKEQRRREAEAAAENERRRKEAEEIARAERERVAAEFAERLRQEAERERIAAAERGAEPAEVLTEDEINIAAAEAAAEVEAPPVEEVKAERVTAGSAFGTSRGLRMVKKGEITDLVAFVTALAGMKHPDLLVLCQQLANRAAKAGMPVDGMKIVEVPE